MKKLILCLSVLIAALSMVACSKDKGKGNANNNGYNNNYNNNSYYGNNNGRYANTPNDSHCNGNGYGNQGYSQNGVYYGNQMRSNCNPQYGNSYGYNNGYMGRNQMYMGSCDTRFIGRSQLCPNGYSCQTSYGPIGICVRNGY